MERIIPSRFRILICAQIASDFCGMNIWAIVWWVETTSLHFLPKFKKIFKPVRMKKGFFFNSFFYGLISLFFLRFSRKSFAMPVIYYISNIFNKLKSMVREKRTNSGGLPKVRQVQYPGVRENVYRVATSWRTWKFNILELSRNFANHLRVSVFSE